jgi:uncharacterized damage-inducible protein DinB
MNATDAIKTQYLLAYRTTAMNTEGMSHDDSVRQPVPAGNCANWILGHLTDVQNEVMKLLGVEPAWDSQALRRTDAPITTEAQAIDWDAMRDAFLASEERCLAAIGGLSPEKLDEPGYPNPLGGEMTFGELLNFLGFHQCYHAGQLGVTRRVAGFDGAISGPAGDAGSEAAD